MSPRIMCHHHTLSDADREFIVGKVDRLKKYFDRINEVSVILDSERHQSLAEILLTGSHINLRVQGQADDMRTAFETALNKTENTLKKAKEKLWEKKNRRHAVTIRRFEGAAGETEAAPAAVAASAFANPIPVEELEPKPMSLEEAHLQMHAREKGLLVFVNSKTDEINILHRNSQNQIELVEFSNAEALMALPEQQNHV